MKRGMLRDTYSFLFRASTSGSPVGTSSASLSLEVVSSQITNEQELYGGRTWC